MTQELPLTSNAPSMSPLPPLKLWTPRLVGAVSILLGFLAGLVLACLNWLRMGLKKKATIHLAAGAAGAVAFLVLVFFLPRSAASSLGLIANVGMFFYLQSQMKRDVDAIRATSRQVEDAQWLSSCLIGLVVLGLTLGVTFLVILTLALVGAPIAE